MPIREDRVGVVAEAISFPDLAIDWSTATAVDTAIETTVDIAIETSAKIEFLPVRFVAPEPVPTPPLPEVMAFEEDTYVPPETEQRLIRHWLLNGGNPSIVFELPPPPLDANVVPFQPRDGVRRCIRMRL